YPSNLIPYSTESPTEQMMQLLQSSDIRDSVVSKFDLMKHYDINPDAIKFPRTKLYNQYADNVKFSQTEYESVRIEVWDTDPELAAKMVAEIINLLNIKARNLQRNKSKELVVIEQKQLDANAMEIDSLSAHLREITEKYDIVDYQAQVTAITRNYYRALADKKSPAALEEMRRAMKNLREQGENYNALKEMIDRANAHFNDLKISLENSKKDVDKELSYSNTVAYPLPEEKKSSPVRLLIVIVAAVSSLLLAILIMAISDNFNNLKAMIKQGR
ncbi:MAG: hypothetical protein JJE25_07095, partial [Bacteroidia bacterium]|nr:hypothetical protein [Bacteroidia bacterium]